MQAPAVNDHTEKGKVHGSRVFQLDIKELTHYKIWVTDFILFQSWLNAVLFSFHLLGKLD